MSNLERRVSAAINHFWKLREDQSGRQGTATGQRDAGQRTAVTGGKHLAGFVELCRALLVEAGIPDAAVHLQAGRELPGYFRAEKNWDLVVVVEKQLLAVIEFKVQVGPSFGNNFNNRAEEAIGNATNLWAADREGAFQPSQRPWLGDVFLLEDCPKSRSPVKTRAPHFPNFPEFLATSSADCYSILLTKLLRERLYDSASLLLPPRPVGKQVR